MKIKHILFILLLTFFVNSVKSQTDLVAKFSAGTFTVDSLSINYRIYIPENYDSSKKYPLIYALHGSDQRGSDNLIQIQVTGLATSWVDSVSQKNNPCFVLVPQCPDNYTWWDPNVYIPNNALLDSTVNKYSIDINRLYITGLSLGGYATWGLLEYFPDKFAAAIPMSAGTSTESVQIFKNVPVWNFHGQADGLVNVAQSRGVMEMYEKLNSKVIYTNSKYRQEINLSDDQIKDHILSHSNPLYTEYPGEGHTTSVWDKAYNTPLLHQWLFSKYKLKTGAIKLSSLKDSKVYPVLNESYSIKWNSENPADSVEIWFSNNDGDSWKLIQSQTNSGSFDWDISKVQDCSLGKIRILLKNSLGFVYGIDESRQFAVNNKASNGTPVVKILNQDFIKNSYISLASINLQLLIADAEKDSVTINLFISNDNGVTFSLFDSLKSSTQMETVNRMVYLNTLCKGKSATSVIKAVISDNVSSAADSTISFTNSKGNLGLCPTLVEPDIQNSDIQIYPNPFIDEFSIQTNGNSEYSVELITIGGRIIYQSKIEGNLHRINLKDLNSGIYFVRMKSNNTVSTRKVIKR